MSTPYTGSTVYQLATYFLVALTIAGCAPPEQIRRYEVARQDDRQRLLGAIVSRGQRAWFFKLVGPYPALEPEADKFREFVSSLQFPADEQAPPGWTLPETWRQKPGDGFRFATIEIPSDPKPLVIAVSELPAPTGSSAEFAATSINMWRQQFGMSPLDSNQMESETQKIPLDDQGTEALLVDLVSRQAPRPGHGQMAGSRRVEEAAPSSPLRFQAPDGWTPGKRVVSRGGFQVRRAAAFDVADGDQRAEVTVTQLPTARAPLLANVNRWRAQVQLEEIDEATLEPQLADIPVAQQTAKFVRIDGKEQVILGVILVRGAMTWFAKMQGDRELVDRQQERFESFVKSFQFDS
jgi:hypothetical protein